MNAKKITISSAIVAAALLGATSSVNAAVSCVSQYGAQYGAGQVCVKTGELQVNKEVLNPKNGKYVDNLSAINTNDPNKENQYHFSAGEEVTFRIRVKNVGDETLTNVQVADTLPTFLEPVSGDFTFNIASLTVGQTEERTVKTRVVAINKLPNDKMVSCNVNTVEAKTADKSDRDTAQVCVEKKAAAELPKAGAEDTIALVLGSILATFAGFKLLNLKPARKIA